MISMGLCAPTATSIQCLFYGELCDVRPRGSRNCYDCAVDASGPPGSWEILLPVADCSLRAIPDTMHAAVYRGESVVSVEQIPTPAIQRGEILIRVEACGICHTDLKKIEHNL